MVGAEWGEDAQGFLSLSFQERVFQFERGSGCEPDSLHQGVASNGMSKDRGHSPYFVCANAHNGTLFALL